MSRYRSPIRTPQQWQHLIQEFYNCQLSPAEFCELHDINIKTFTNNRYKHRNAIELNEETPFIEVDKPTIEAHSASVSQQSIAPLSLRLDAGNYQLYIPMSATPAWIADLLREVAK